MFVNLKLEESKVLLPATALAYGPSPRHGAPARRDVGKSLAIVGVAVDLGSEVDPRIRTRTASGDPYWSDNAMSGQRSPASSCPITQRSPRLEALIRIPIRVHGKFLAI